MKIDKSTRVVVDVSSCTAEQKDFVWQIKHRRKHRRNIKAGSEIR